MRLNKKNKIWKEKKKNREKSYQERIKSQQGMSLGKENK